MAGIVLAVCVVVSAGAVEGEKAVRVGIAWQQSADNFARAIKAVKAAGGVPVILDQMRPCGFDYDGTELQAKYMDENGILLQQYADIVKRETYHGTDIEQMMQGIQAVVFLGGGDISPTLFATPEPWHGIEAERNYQTTRDLSEYLTMTYCLDHHIPILGLCRGMQMLAVVSGAPLIQDLGAYYAQLGKADRYVHRAQRDDNGKRHYTPHNVTVIDTTSLLYSITGTTTVRNVPSWHHQAAGDIKGTPLRVTAVTRDDGDDVIEAIERTDVPFALGVQYHPEEAVRMHLAGESQAARFMSLEDGLDYFRALIKAAGRIIKGKAYTLDDTCSLPCWARPNKVRPKVQQPSYPCCSTCLRAVTPMPLIPPSRRLPNGPPTAAGLPMPPDAGRRPPVPNMSQLPTRCCRATGSCLPSFSSMTVSRTSLISKPTASGTALIRKTNM